MWRSLGVCRCATRCKKVLWLAAGFTSCAVVQRRKRPQAQSCEQVERQAEDFYNTCRVGSELKRLGKGFLESRISKRIQCQSSVEREKDGDDGLLVSYLADSGIGAAALAG